MTKPPKDICKGCYYSQHRGCNAPDEVPEDICPTEQVYKEEYKK